MHKLSRTLEAKEYFSLLNGSIPVLGWTRITANFIVACSPEMFKHDSSF